jgi:hypothetical protein
VVARKEGIWLLLAVMVSICGEEIRIKLCILFCTALVVGSRVGRPL